MNYPLISEYVEAIKMAEDNFEELSYLRPVLDAEGQPVMSSGNFAVVFKMKDERDGKSYAVRCFHRDQEGREESYRLIEEELKDVESPYLVSFRYIDQELFVDSSQTDETEFPVLLMDWVEGITLDKYLRENIDDQYALEMLAYRFSQLAQWLIPQPFAHGDLKPDNILVREDGTLVLVDYDGMYVPAMKGQKARELGSPDFRHPLRTEDDFDEHIDDFSLVSILLSLKAIALHPELLEEYGASDRLLFSENDYRNISQSNLLKKLFPSNNSELNVLMSLFMIALEKKSFSNVSFRLFNLCRPKEAVNVNLSTEVTKKDLADAWVDEYGVKYSLDKKRLLESPQKIKEYVIRKETKIICDYAFCSCRDLTSLIIPDSVILIGCNAFSHCSNLTSISIPNSVTSIGAEAFWGCKSINRIILPNGLITISKFTFRDCYNLNSIIIPSSVKSIGEFAFEDCWGLKSINIPEGVISIGSNAFFRCSDLASIIIPNSLTCIGSSAFGGCNSLSSPIHNSTTFFYMPKSYYGKYTIPNGIKKIYAGAFAGCDELTSVEIPNSVACIENFAFSGCFSLKKPVYTSKLFAYMPISISEYSIPDGIKKICGGAFKGCSELTSIKIPNSVTSIGDFAFSECSGLISIEIPDSVTTIGKSAFGCCEKLTSVTIPTSVTYIGSRAFSGCIRVTSLIVDELNNSFDSRNNCNAIIETRTGTLIAGCCSSIIPNNVNSIGYSAFYGCSGLTSIVIPNGVTTIGDSAFMNCFGLTSINISESVKNIGDFAFSGCSGLTSIVIPNSVTTIGDYAFSECFGLTSIILSDRVKNIGVSAFSDCSELTSIIIPNSVTTIGDLAFGECSNLKEVKILASDIFLGNLTFGRCRNLSKITFLASVKRIGIGVFDECYNLFKIIIPNGTKEEFEKLLPKYKDKLVEE